MWPGNTDVFRCRDPCRKDDNCHAFWIGVRRGKNQEWTSIGEELIKKQSHIWAPLYPADDSGECVVLSLQKDEENKGKTSGFWKNEECIRPFRFVCFGECTQTLSE